MLLAGLSNLFSLELIIYTIFIVTAIYVCLHGDDLLPLMPLCIAAYISPSMANNPGKNPDSVFALANGGLYLLIMATVLVGALIFHIVKNRQRFLGRKHVLLPGMLILSGAYLLSGIGSPNYSTLALKNLLFSALQGGAILLPYWLFSGGIRWRKTRRDYFAWIGFSAGCLLLLEITWIYLTRDIVIDGIIVREHIYTGWGMYNNIGGMLAMMIPFAFYLATKYRKGWIGTVAGSAFLIGVILTCSRSSILVGTLIYFVCIICMLYYANNRKANTVALITTIAAIVIGTLVFHSQLYRLFSELLNRGIDPNTRDTIYKNGLSLFAQNPVFGASFYPPAGMSWNWSTTSFAAFFPARWHNTIVQLLASCGVVGFGAYLYHRAQTILLVFRRKNKDAVFLGLSISVLLLTSLLDCHLFNLAPAVFYSMTLAFIGHGKK